MHTYVCIFVEKALITLRFSPSPLKRKKRGKCVAGNQWNAVRCDPLGPPKFDDIFSKLEPTHSIANPRNGASPRLDASPSLDSLDAVALSALTPAQLAALAHRLAAAQCAVAAALQSAALTSAGAKGTPDSSSSADADRILDADAIARELGQSRRWVFRNARKIPCIRRISRKSLAAPAAQVRRRRDLQRP